MRRLLTVLALSILSLPAAAKMQTRAVEWSVGSQQFIGALVYDDATKARRPGLVMVPDWKGVTASAIEQAKKVAGRDYVILVTDMYGKGVRPKDDNEAMAQVTSLYKDVPAMRARAARAVEVLKEQSKSAPIDVARIGAFGYCFGGSSVLELARSGAKLAGIVTFHGGLNTAQPATANSVHTPLLVLNGADDRGQKDNIVPFEQEMDRAGADWTFVNFSGAVHCFALEAAINPPGCMYNPRAAKRAYVMMNDFFRERFAAK